MITTVICMIAGLIIGMRLDELENKADYAEYYYFAWCVPVTLFFGAPVSTALYYLWK